LLVAGGRPLIEHVVRSVRCARKISHIVVLTDDPRIADTCSRFGAEARLTRPDHATGSDRIGEVLPTLAADIIVNVQGDEPEVEAETLNRVVERLEADPELDVATAAARWPKDVPFEDPNRVKVVTDLCDRALYFSRAPIPGRRPTDPELDRAGPWPLLHVGVYAFRRAALERFLTFPRGRLEAVESLEQLRLLENGMSIGVVRIAAAPAGIDTEEDWVRFRTRVERSSPRQGPADQVGGAVQRSG
jgi:3-deoxy-manno-octulosonate cytidylyltransferase (CMP-KDO synthetase)